MQSAPCRAKIDRQAPREGIATKTRLRTLAAAVLIAAILTALAGGGLLERLDLAAGDALYQSRKSAIPDIVLINIDQQALEELGPYDQWTRAVMARAIEQLNRDETARPAAIAIDILYTGESTPEADEALAAAAGRYNNVITAALATFGNTVAAGKDGADTLHSAVTNWDQPYDALRAVTTQGHINAMLDTDGIFRHHLLTLTLPDGTEVPSMALAAAQTWWSAHQITPPPLPETAGRGFWYLPFTGHPGDFDQHISIAGLLAGETDPDYFTGKIVLIGPYAPGLRDSYPTSIDHAQEMYGVEIQANAIQALLQGVQKREVRTAPQLALLFLTLLLCFAGFWKRPVLPSTILWGGICAGWVLVCKAACAAGWLLHVLWLPVGASILYIGCLAANYIQAAQARREVINHFKRYVAPDVVDEILRNDPEAMALGGRRAEITVLFVDIRGFTTLSDAQASAPQQVAETLNDYLALFARCILRHRGTLDKFIGDAAMAFWGAPTEDPDHVFHAVQAAMDIVNEGRGGGLHFGIGIHTGPAVVGNMGARDQRMDYTAIGDTVNTASRLESVNRDKGTIINLSRAVVDALGDRIDVTRQGLVGLKGKEKEVEVFTLNGIRDKQREKEDKP